MSLQQEFVLENAVIWARTPMAKIKGGMHIRDGKIFQVYNQEAVPTGNASSIDLKGMHVIPGLIDAHRHFFISALSAAQWRCEHLDIKSRCPVSHRCCMPVKSIGQRLGLLLRHGPLQVEPTTDARYKRNRFGGPWISCYCRG